MNKNQRNKNQLKKQEKKKGRKFLKKIIGGR